VNRFQQFCPFLRRLSGGVLLIAGLVVAYFWFYKLAPMRHLADSNWLETHTEKARWLEEQKDYERMGSSPDLEFRGDRIGYYGDKKWFLWLEHKATTDENFRVCGCTETALALMSNQHVDSWDRAGAGRGEGARHHQWRRPALRSSKPVNIFSVPDPLDFNQFQVRDNFINDAIVAQTNAISMLRAAQFFHAVRKRVFCQTFDCLDDPLRSARG
jgi:hypothetical protein